MPTETTLSDELGTPLSETDYSLDDLNSRIQRNPQAVVDALVWTREYWKWFQPRNDARMDESGTTPVGHDPNIWYDEAVRKLFHAIVDIDTEEGCYAEPETHGLDPEWAGLVATAVQFYEENYHHLRKGPEQESAERSYS